MGVVSAIAVHTPKEGMVAWSAVYSTGSSGTGMMTRMVCGGTPPARG